MAITAAQVKELRERTGAGMMECKKALVAADGNIETAIEEMRKSGQAKASKKAGRIAAEGLVVVMSEGNKAVIVEINCETDFVAKDENFANFANEVAHIALENGITEVTALGSANMPQHGKTVEERRAELIAKVGENVALRRLEFVNSDASITHYSHGGRIGVLVEYQGGNEDLGKDLAMHIAAAKPEFINEDQVPQEKLEKEKEILMAQAQDSGKPQEIIEKMMVGRIKKYLGEICLVGQPFVKDPDVKVGKLLENNNASIKAFYRFEVGEGIEKKVDNFVDEVMAQAGVAKD